MPELSSQRNSSSSLISVAARLLSSRLQHAFAENKIDITIEQWTLLFYLWEKDGLTPRELAISANKEKSTITRQVDALEKRKLITREVHQGDKRNKIIKLTSKGKAIKNGALEAANNVTIASEEHISEEDLLIFKKVLKSIISNIKK